MSMGAHERPNRGATDVWLTPLSIVQALGTFDLDPCGYPGHQTATQAFTLPMDGLAAPWDHRSRVWLNPPYSEVGLWLDKLAEHPGGGVALVFARMETRWAQKALHRAQSVFFPAGRFTFLKPNGKRPSGNAGAPSMFLSFGESPDWDQVGPGWVAK